MGEWFQTCRICSSIHRPSLFSGTLLSPRGQSACLQNVLASLRCCHRCQSLILEGCRLLHVRDGRCCCRCSSHLCTVSRLWQWRVSFHSRTGPSFRFQKKGLSP